MTDKDLEEIKQKYGFTLRPSAFNGKPIKFVCTNKDLMNSMLDELDYIVYASKLYGGKHVMEELDNRYKNKLMS